MSRHKFDLGETIFSGNVNFLLMNDAFKADKSRDLPSRDTLLMLYARPARCSPWNERLSRRSLTFLTCILVVKMGCALWLRRLAISSKEPTYTYMDEDYPQAWPILMAGPVLMPVEDTVRYMIESPDSKREWDAMIPGNGIIRLGEQRRPFSISMFHQLRCISILRKEMMGAQKNGEHQT
ncbi:hypothetical protein C8R43DRAFT_470854 [Mycena crocata]|nr:hypothetical protein C8R43DRAFT_470854 [Mycena crocata]